MQRIIFAGIVFAGLLIAAPVSAQEMMQPDGQPFTQEQTDFFETRIRPVLVRECYSCHSIKSGQARGGLQLDTREGLLAGGDYGPALVPGDPDDSPLISAIEYDEWAMPPSKQLAQNVVDDFRAWVGMGAPDPRTAIRKREYKATISDQDIRDAKKTWAFSRPKNSEIPDIENTAWARNSIDPFVLAKLEDAGLQPSPDAEPLKLVRRLAYDLTGLAPDQQQVDWFLDHWKQDPENAIAIAVDGLLKSERYGERWGRHWLDVARYAESTGRETNATFPHAWRYRDYVIDAFNDDKPYNEFIQEQIAGDLLRAKTKDEWAEHITATGFLCLGPKSLREQNPRQFNLDLVDEQLDVTTRVVLGLSVACARCHDHKFDPIPQDDYYAMSGIFMSTSTHYGTIDNQQNRRPSNLLQLPVSDPDSYLETISIEDYEDLSAAYEEADAEYKQMNAEYRRQRRSGNLTGSVKLSEVVRAGTTAAVMAQLVNSYDEQGNPHTFVMGVQDRDNAINAKVLIRGEVDQPSDEVDRGFVRVLTSRQPRLSDDASGRLEMARWMTDDKNPLTARVMVNRVWKHMTGYGIVRTTENFGSTGQPPTHPELLDHLAVEFMNNDWSVKELIRKIATSRTYRQSAAFNQDSFESDPENKLIWRRTPRRLDAEQIRDSMLQASGMIDYDRPRGSIVNQAGETFVRDGVLLSAIPFLKNVLDKGELGVNREMARPRGRDRRDFAIEINDNSLRYRSVFLPVIRDNLPVAMEAFDFAAPSMVVGVRGSTNSPTQALYMLNDEFVIRQSREMAESIIREHGSTAERLNAVFRRVFGRNANEQELAAIETFYRTFETSPENSVRDDLMRRRRNRFRGNERPEPPLSEVSQREQQKLAAICQAIFASAQFRFLD